MNKELEALLLSAAKALGLGVVGVDAERARDFDVPLGTFVKCGNQIPGGLALARTSGYYCYRGLSTPRACLFVHEVPHGDGRRHFGIYVLDESSTGYGGFVGQSRAFSLLEIKAYLRGVADGVSAVRPFGKEQA